MTNASHSHLSLTPLIKKFRRLKIKMKALFFSIFFLMSTAVLASDRQHDSKIIIDESTSSVKNYSIKGSLESDRRLGCITLNNISNTTTPPELFIGVKDCFDEGELDNAAIMYFFARLYGAFDGKRVDDNSAGQAIAVMQRSIFSQIDKVNIKEFQTLIKEEYGKGSNKFDEFCQASKKNGPPSYYPRYMILHGIKAFSGIKGDGLKSGFDTEAEWSRLYSQNCKEKSGRQAAWPKTRFEIYKGSVLYKSPWGERTVGSADTDSFEALSEAFGRDKNNVFFGEKIVPGAEPASFKIFDFYTGRDKNSVYRGIKRCDECDAETFRVMDKNRYVDKNSAYAGSGDNLRRLPNVDVASYTGLNSSFSKDKDNVYYLDRYIIAGADAPSFKLKRCGSCIVCAEDKNRCYSNDKPVPCDCKPYSGPRLYRTTKIPQGKALVLAPHFGIDLTHTEKDKATFLGVVGHWGIVPGRNTFSLECNGKPGSLTLYAKQGRVYRLKKQQDTTCDAEILRPALIQGREEGPAIYIRLAGVAKAKSEVELQPGTQTITAVCRDVNREKVRESSVELNVVLEAGRIYKLNADFLSPDDKCDVRVTLVE